MEEEGVILLREVDRSYSFPQGLKEFQGKGFYRLERSEEGRTFSYTHGLNSIKEFLHPPVAELIKMRSDLSQGDEEGEEGKMAFIGLRNCDLKAIKILDNVFMKGSTLPDLIYTKRRKGIFTVVVNCTEPSPNCFCISMNGSPFVEGGCDISVTEIDEGFIVRAYTENGRDILKEIKGEVVKDIHLRKEVELKRRAEEYLKKIWDIDKLFDSLLRKLESPVWEEVERRCLACGSCTMVCPTCFCYEVVDEVSFDFSESTRIRKWDVCFREEFSAIHGVPLRSSIKARYRQWLMHKFAYWIHQFGEYGCVGCGRCIAWCPVGIDIREEVKKVLEG